MSSGTGTYAPAAFVFEDLTGRRWPRLKRIAVAASVVVMVLGAGLLVAVLSVAPGRTTPFRAAIGIAEQVRDWPQRGTHPGPDPTPAEDAGVADEAGGSTASGSLLSRAQSSSAGPAARATANGASPASVQPTSPPLAAAAGAPPTAAPSGIPTPRPSASSRPTPTPKPKPKPSPGLPTT